MDSAPSIPDSTDWLNTPLHLFSHLENALHCQICKEFYDTPMLTSCSHTFCSKCIRTSLSADGKCPACRTADQASKLRNNWALQEVVSAFLVARPSAISLARREKELEEVVGRPGKRKRGATEGEDGREEGRTTRSKSRRIAASQTSEGPEIVEIEDEVEDDSTYKPEPQIGVDDGLVECPLGCGKRMKIEQVDPHLDRCEEERQAQEKLRSNSRTPITAAAGQKSFGARSKNSRPQERLSELNYSMLKDAAMRKKLEDLGVPAWGSKQLMMRRHVEWVNLWNANCDSDHPRTKRELLQELDTWERTQGGRAPNTHNNVANGIMRKDFDAAGWASKNRDEFSRLIADARRKKSNPAVSENSSKDNSMNKATLSAADDMAKSDSASVPPSSQAGSAPDQSSSSAPYAAHPEALAGVRAKVEALNGGEHIEPKLNADFRNHGQVSPSNRAETSSTHLHPETESTNSPLHAQSSFTRTRESSQDEHTVARNTGSPCDIPSHLRSPVKKVPMFALPAEMICDIDGADGDGGGEGGGEHG